VGGLAKLAGKTVAEVPLVKSLATSATPLNLPQLVGSVAQAPAWVAKHLFGTIPKKLGMQGAEEVMAPMAENVVSKAVGRGASALAGEGAPAAVAPTGGEILRRRGFSEAGTLVDTLSKGGAALEKGTEGLVGGAGRVVQGVGAGTQGVGKTLQGVGGALKPLEPQLLKSGLGEEAVSSYTDPSGRQRVQKWTPTVVR
jgi:hypothetical protein